MSDKDKATDRMHGGNTMNVTDTKTITSASNPDNISNSVVLKGTFHPEKEKEFTKFESEQDFT